MSTRRPAALIGFVVPTVVVGYGVVIPRSCIAGVNELTIGFGTTILGAVLTYIAGQRAVLPKGVCMKPPLGVRIARAINRQAASPSGWFGRVLGLIWPHEHGRLNAEVLDALDLHPGQRVLEIGSGTGHALREAARRVAPGRVVGVDISELMADLARRLNHAAVARGDVEVRAGDIEALDLNGATFDRIFSVNCIYFWRDVDAVLAKLARPLKPGGKLLLAFRPEGEDIPARFRDSTYRFRARQMSRTPYAARAFVLKARCAPALPASRSSRRPRRDGELRATGEAAGVADRRKRLDPIGGRRYQSPRILVSRWSATVDPAQGSSAPGSM